MAPWRARRLLKDLVGNHPGEQLLTPSATCFGGRTGYLVDVDHRRSLALSHFGSDPRSDRLGGFEDADRELSRPADLADRPFGLICVTSEFEVREALNELLDRHSQFETGQV